MRHSGVDVESHLDVVRRQPGREARRSVAEEVQAPNAQVGWREAVQIVSTGGAGRVRDRDWDCAMATKSDQQWSPGPVKSECPKALL